MKLPLLGIITIVVLQLGFTAFNALDRPLASVYAVKRVTSETAPIAALPDEADSDFDTYAIVRSDVRNFKNRDLNSSPGESRRRARATAQKVIFRNTLIRIPYAKPLMHQLVAIQRPWYSAELKHPQPMRSGGESENFPIPSDRSSEKRSFVARSASVLKKPYDWIKVLGSKLN